MTAARVEGTKRTEEGGEITGLGDEMLSGVTDGGGRVRGNSKHTLPLNPADTVRARCPHGWTISIPLASWFPQVLSQLRLLYPNSTALGAYTTGLHVSRFWTLGSPR